MWRTVWRNCGQVCQPFSISLTWGRPFIIWRTASITAAAAFVAAGGTQNSRSARKLLAISTAAPAAVIRFLSARVAPNAPMRKVPPGIAFAPWLDAIEEVHVWADAGRGQSRRLRPSGLGVGNWRRRENSRCSVEIDAFAHESHGARIGLEEAEVGVAVDGELRTLVDRRRAARGPACEPGGGDDDVRGRGISDWALSWFDRSAALAMGQTAALNPFGTDAFGGVERCDAQAYVTDRAVRGKIFDKRG